MRHVTFAAILLALFALIGCGPKYAIVTPLESPIPQPSTLVVGTINDELPLDTKVGDRPSAEDIGRFQELLRKELLKIKFFSEAYAKPDDIAFDVVGSILDYKKGSGAVRFFIGFGLGNSKVVTNLKLIDHRTNQVVFAANFTGSVGDWSSKGNKMFDQVAKNFAKAIKKEMKRLGVTAKS